MSFIEFVVYDYSDETSKVRWEVADATDVSAASTIVSGIDAIIRGTIGPSTLFNTEPIQAGSTARPASADAQREDKWVLEFYDAVLNKTFYRSLPTATRTLLAGGTEILDPSQYAALKAAVDGVVLSPYGNPMTLVSVKYAAARL